MATNIILLLGSLLLTFSFSLSFAAYDRLADFCVANPKLPEQANGFPCKESKDVTQDDFFFSGLNRTVQLWPTTGSALAWANARQVPGLNSLGVSLVRVEIEVGGYFPFHINHAAEVIYLIQGVIETGFFASYPDQRLFKKSMSPGDMFVIPEGLIHYQKNVGTVKVSAIAALSGQDIYPVMIPNTLFGSHPTVEADLLARDFRTDVPTVKKILANFEH